MTCCSISGLALVKRLCDLGMTVLVGSIDRDFPKEEKTLTESLVKSGKLSLFYLDLASFTSIKSFHSEVVKHHKRIDYLINNAGIMLVPYGHTKEGFESHLGVNFIGHAYLTKLFLPNMREDQSMMVNLGSSTSRIGRPSSLLRAEFYGEELSYSPHYQYGHSKLAIILYTEALARQLRADNSSCSVVSVHPGIVLTRLYQHVYYPLRLLQRYILRKICIRTAEEGAQVLFNAMLNHDHTKDGGFYIFNEYRRPLAEEFDYELFMRHTDNAITEGCSKSQ